MNIKQVVEKLAIMLAIQRDEFFCSDCFEYGGRDCPDSIVCRTTCFRSYCDICAVKRDFVCACGELLLAEEEWEAREDCKTNARCMKSDTVISDLIDIFESPEDHVYSEILK